MNGERVVGNVEKIIIYDLNDVEDIEKELEELKQVNRNSVRQERIKIIQRLQCIITVLRTILTIPGDIVSIAGILVEAYKNDKEVQELNEKAVKIYSEYCKKDNIEERIKELEEIKLFLECLLDKKKFLQNFSDLVIIKDYTIRTVPVYHIIKIDPNIYPKLTLEKIYDIVTSDYHEEKIIDNLISYLNVWFIPLAKKILKDERIREIAKKEESYDYENIELYDD